ncbi:aminoglycoside 3'-phosphotransferase [soil metagenome]
MLKVPGELRDEYASWSWEVVSVYPGKSVMHRLSNDAGDTRFLKIVRHGWTPSAEAEAERTAWARAFLPVPHILERGTTHESSWLLTEGIPGFDATSAAFRVDVPGLVSRLADGLRRFHEAPSDACPFQFRIDDAIRLVRRRLETGQIDPARDFHPEFATLTAEAAVEELVCSAPDSEDLVVCHGDYCVPNVLLHENVVVGYVDLGELGVADRWWDLAVATWSVTWNFGPGYESRFLDEYGVQADAHRIAFYRLLYDLAS